MLEEEGCLSEILKPDGKLKGQKALIEAARKRGMGLGLSLCRSILRAHGSDIVLRDAYPHGCVFSFALPAAELREEAPVGVVEEGSADVER